MTTAATAVSEATSEDWYAAEQSKSLLKNIEEIIEETKWLE